jgi:hypothetical protein
MSNRNLLHTLTSIGWGWTVFMCIIIYFILEFYSNGLYTETPIEKYSKQTVGKTP